MPESFSVAIGTTIYTVSEGTKEMFLIAIPILALFIGIKIAISLTKNFVFNDGYESKKSTYPSSYV